MKKDSKKEEVILFLLKKNNFTGIHFPISCYICPDNL